jgi:hypothetical protein
MDKSEAESSRFQLPVPTRAEDSRRLKTHVFSYFQE